MTNKIKIKITPRQAYVLGVEAAVERFGQDCNPYTDIPTLSHAWLNGWRHWWDGVCDERGNPYPDKLDK